MQKEFIEHWASQLFQIGWRGSGQGKNLGISPLTQGEFDRCTLVMKYKPEKGVQEFTGRMGDKGALEKFLNIMDDLLEEIEKRFYKGIKDSG